MGNSFQNRPRQQAASPHPKVRFQRGLRPVWTPPGAPRLTDGVQVRDDAHQPEPGLGQLGWQRGRAAANADLRGVLEDRSALVSHGYPPPSNAAACGLLGGAGDRAGVGVGVAVGGIAAGPGGGVGCAGGRGDGVAVGGMAAGAGVGCAGGRGVGEGCGWAVGCAGGWAGRSASGEGVGAGSLGVGVGCAPGPSQHFTVCPRT